MSISLKKAVSESTKSLTCLSLTHSLTHSLSLFLTNSLTYFSLSLGPLPPDMVNVQRINGTHMFVSWRPIPLLRARGFITSYTIRYQAVSTRTRQDASLEVAVPGDRSNVTIGKLDQDLQYTLTVSGGTVAGDGELSEATIVPLPPQQKETGIYSECACVFVIMVIIKIYRLRFKIIKI